MRLQILSFKQTLVLAFALLLGMLVIVGAIGLVSMMRLHGAVNEVVLGDNAKLALANTMRTSIEQMDIELLRLMLTDKPAKQKRHLSKITWYSAQFDESLASFDQLLATHGSTDSEVAARDRIVQDRDTCRLLVGNVVEAAQVEGADLTSTFTPADAALKDWAVNAKELGSIVQVLTDAAVVNSDRNYRLGWLLSMAGVGTAIAFGILIAAWLTRRVERQLGGDPAYAADLVKQIATGDLSVEIATTNSAPDSLLASTRTMQSELRQMIGHINATLSQVTAGAQQVAQGNSELSSRTQQQAASLEEIAASMEELASTVIQNSNNARQADQLSIAAHRQANNGGEVAARAVAAMGEITAASHKIAAIVNVIDDIAFQTNLLALNAAVEAARAGEMGRGFAVVASEVRGLAGRCATAAREVKVLINDSVGKVTEGSRLVRDFGSTLGEIVAAVKKVSDVVTEISAASLEQSKGVEQVNQAISQIDGVTQQNAALVEESAAASEAITGQVDRLRTQVEVFKLGPQQGSDSLGARTRDTLAPHHESEPQFDSIAAA